MSDPVVTPVQKALDKVATKKWFQFGTKAQALAKPLPLPKAKAQKGALEPVSVVEQASVQVSEPLVQEVAVKKNSRLLSCCRRSVDAIEPLVVREVAAAVAPAVAALVAVVPSADVPSAEVLAAALVDAAVSAVADALDVVVDAVENPVVADASAVVLVAPPQLEMAQVPSAELANQQSQTDSPVESVSDRVEESVQESANPVVSVESQ